MAYLVGVALALLFALLARWARFDRDRALYPTLLAWIASYYVLFATLSGSTRALLVESSVLSALLLIAFVGFRFNLWWVVAALAGHGLFDTVHAHLVANPGVPTWWPPFCMAFDVSAALALAWLLKRSIPRGVDASRSPGGS